MLRRVAGPTPQNRNASALHALQRLSTIASALSHHKELFPDDVSTRGDVDACSRASRASYINKYTLSVEILLSLATGTHFNPLCLFKVYLIIWHALGFVLIQYIA